MRDCVLVVMTEKDLKMGGKNVGGGREVTD